MLSEVVKIRANLVAPGPSSVGLEYRELEGCVLSVNNALDSRANFFRDQVRPRGLIGIYVIREGQRGQYKRELETGVVGSTKDTLVVEQVGVKGLKEEGKLYEGDKIERSLPTTACGLAFLLKEGFNEIHLYGCEHADLTGKGYRRGVEVDCRGNNRKDTSYFIGLDKKRRELIEACQIATSNGAKIVNKSQVLEEKHWT